MTRRDLFRRVLGALAAPLVPAAVPVPARGMTLVYGTHNVYIPTTEMSSLVVSYARDHARYRINKYVTVRGIHDAA